MKPRVLAQKPPSGEGYPRTVAKWLAVVQILLGLSAMILFVIAVVICRVLGVLNVAVAIFFVVGGIFDLISAKTASRSILVAVTTASILSVMASTLFLYSASYGTVVRFQGLPVTHAVVTWEILQGVLMFLCLIEGILSIIFLVLASRTLCSCCQLVVQEAATKDVAIAQIVLYMTMWRSCLRGSFCTVTVLNCEQIVILPCESPETTVNPSGPSELRSSDNNGRHFVDNATTIYFQDYQPPPPDYKDVA